MVKFSVLGGVEQLLSVLMHRWLHEQSDYRQGVEILGRKSADNRGVLYSRMVSNNLIGKWNGSVPVSNRSSCRHICRKRSWSNLLRKRNHNIETEREYVQSRTLSFCRNGNRLYRNHSADRIGLFAVDRRTKFNSHIQPINSWLYESLESKHLFVALPERGCAYV